MSLTVGIMFHWHFKTYLDEKKQKCRAKETNITEKQGVLYEKEIENMFDK